MMPEERLPTAEIWVVMSREKGKRVRVREAGEPGEAGGTEGQGDAAGGARRSIEQGGTGAWKA